MFSPYNYKYLIKLYHATKITVVPHQATASQLHWYRNQQFTEKYVL